MKVCILPVLKNTRETFGKFVETIDNLPVDRCFDCHIQCSSDGVWCCDDEAVCLRTENKIKFNVITMEEAKAGEEGDHIKEMEDFVEHTSKIEYKIHPSSGITLEDIEEQKLKGHQDYGNAMTSPFYINGKPCTLIILNEGADIDDETFDFIASECQK
jgi:hypothetical protein